MTEPAAQQAYRVPRSDIDRLYAPAEPTEQVRVASAVIVSIDSEDTVTVLMHDEQISGVLVLGDIGDLAVGDIVTVELRGDLYVIPDAYTEGMATDSPHVVSDEEPTDPESVHVPVGDSMRDTTAWLFTTPAEQAAWLAEPDPSGVGMHLAQQGGASSPATLWSTVQLDVQPGDTFDVVLQAAWLAGAATTAQLWIAYGVTADELPTSGTWYATAVGPAQSIGTAGPVTLAYEGTVPTGIPIAGGEYLEPASARIGWLLTNASGNADVQLRNTTLAWQTGWGIGSLWLNPAAEYGAMPGGAAVHDDTPSATNLPSTTSYLPVPGVKKAVVTAPPTQGGVALVTFTLTTVLEMVQSPAIIYRIYVDGVATAATMRVSNGATGGQGTHTDTSVTTVIGLAPYQTVELVLHYAYASAPSTVSKVYQASTVALFVPGAYTSTIAAWRRPQISMYDGDSWRPDRLFAASIDLSQAGTDPPYNKNTTTTTLTKSAANLNEGDNLTLTATVGTASGTPTGSVTFSKATSPTGPWTTIGSNTLTSGGASLKWASSRGVWYFRAVYQGSVFYLGSTSAATGAVTVTGTTQRTVSVTLQAAWAQAYDANGNQITGSGNDTAVHQGYNGPTYGNRKSLLGFDPALPADAEVTKVTLTCSSWAKWHYPAGGTVRVGWHDKATKPTNWGVGAGEVAKSSHDVDTGSWTVNLTSWADTAAKRSNFKGLTIGPGAGTSAEYFGYSADGAAGKFQLAITYRTYA